MRATNQQVDEITARKMAAEALGRPVPRLARPRLVTNNGAVVGAGVIVVVAPGDPNHRGDRRVCTQIKIGD